MLDMDTVMVVVGAMDIVMVVTMDIVMMMNMDILMGNRNQRKMGMPMIMRMVMLNTMIMMGPV